MSDETERPGQHEEAGDEVEGHSHHKLGATAERADETENDSDDEVEAHGTHHKLA
jgi:hypothetical protein